MRFIEHRGYSILFIDFSNCNAKQMLLLLEQVRAEISGNPAASVLVLADFSGAQIDRKVATRMKEVLVLDRPFVKRSAWIGTDNVPEVFYEHFKNFSQRDFPTFKTREEALDWLVSQP